MSGAMENRKLITARRHAQTLSSHGWRFHEQQGVIGHYYEGRGPRGLRIMSLQKPDQKEAFLAALSHAYRVQFLS